MSFRGGDGQRNAIFLWISLLFLLSGLLLYLIFSTLPEPSRHHFPVFNERFKTSFRAAQGDKILQGDERNDDSGKGN